MGPVSFAFKHAQRKVWDGPGIAETEKAKAKQAERSKVQGVRESEIQCDGSKRDDHQNDREPSQHG